MKQVCCRKPFGNQSKSQVHAATDIEEGVPFWSRATIKTA